LDGVCQVVGVIEGGLGSPAEVDALRVVERLQLLDAVAGNVKKPADTTTNQLSVQKTAERAA
jgi:hypothetical protein